MTDSNIPSDSGITNVLDEDRLESADTPPLPKVEPPDKPKTLTDWFDRVFVINCAHRPDRLQEFRDEITTKGIADLDKITVVPAVIGDYTTHPAGFGGGNGAWGCLQSHRRIMEDLLHMRDERGDLAWESALILEDDVFFLDHALEDLDRFMKNVPGDWGQLYLGGQHRQKVSHTPHNGVVVGNSVNRTHAYAVSRTFVQKIYCHISYMTDYMGNNFHIDHQLERAHQRKDWPVYCPEKWICGQRAGTSNVSGKTNADQVWL